MLDMTSFDEAKHPRGHHSNPGRFSEKSHSQPEAQLPPASTYGLEVRYPNGDVENLTVTGQELGGDPEWSKLIGFVNTRPVVAFPGRYDVDLTVEDAAADPRKVVGMRPVVADKYEETVTRLTCTVTAVKAV